MKKEITVQNSIEKMNVKEFLEQQFSLSSRKIKQLLKEKKIWINGKAAYFDNYVNAGDKLAVDLAETGKDSTVPEALPIDIIFEDEYFLAVNKPAGMLVHPTPNHPGGTLANGVKHYLLSKELDVPIRLANRIDMDTSGVVVIAKSGEAHAALAAQFDQDSCEKYYLAVAQGHFRSSSGVINKPIGKDEENPIRRAVRPDGQHSVTELLVLEQYMEAALLQLKLITGRTHQIRVHLSSIGHPLLGDQLYGGNMQQIKRQALHAYELRFMHPFEKNFITLQADLPQDMKQLIEALRDKQVYL